MAILKSISAVICLVFAAAFLIPAAHANQWNERTKLSFSQPVELPGRVLPAGSYWFVLLSSSSNRDIVQVFNSSNSRLYATLVTVPTIRPNTADMETEVVLAERRHTQPEALWKWYYPGLATGHEFLYPAREERNLRQDPKQDVSGVPPLTVRNTGTEGN